MSSALNMFGVQGASELERPDDIVQHAAAASETALAPYAILGTAPETPYDDLAQLASDLCEAPVALLNLFGTAGQWFKATVGYDGAVPPIEQSLCRHAIDVPDLLVIPDLTADPRTSADVVVVEAGARFYAGAPLRSDDGTFLGTLCIIDFAARPAGLSAAQASGLQALARQVMATLELRRLLREREMALVVRSAERDRLASSEAHWRGLFEGMREGFAVSEVIRDDTGKVVDWRHLEVNQAFVDVAGFQKEEVIGRTLLEIAPQTPARWIEFSARVVDSGQPATFDHLGARNGRMYDGRSFPIGHDQFAVIFLDVTDRVLAERRAAALVAIADELRDLSRAEDMTRAAARIVGETLQVSRVGYGRLDPARETITLEPDWTAPGIASIAGVHRFADYGDLLDELLAGQALVIDDVRIDPRSATDPERLRAMSVAALVNMPVRARGRTMALLVVHHDQPRHWSTEEVAFLRDVSDRLELAIGRLDAEIQRTVRNHELSHRLKNTLAMVQAIASQTLKGVDDRSAVETFERRLTALASAHDVLLSGNWIAASLDAAIHSVFENIGLEDRATLSGEPIDLAPRATLTVTLLFHELATNALKYGALSLPAGRVAVDWSVRQQDGRPTLFVTWTERGGPPVAAPSRRGFGSRLINMGLAGTGGVDLGYDPAGLLVRMSAPLDDLTEA